jgi:hypothetical protein
MLGVSYPVGLVIAAAGLLFPSGSAAWLTFVIPGGVLLAIGWLGLPAWPLVLARLVFSKPHRVVLLGRNRHENRVRFPGLTNPAPP